MERNIEFKGFEAPGYVRNDIDRLTSKVEKNLNTFSPESVHLRLMVEQNVVRALYSISLTFDLPGNTLAAREQQHDLKGGIRAAFAELERQLEKYKASLREEHWKRPKRREQIREMKVEAASSTVVQSKRDLFFSMVTP